MSKLIIIDVQTSFIEWILQTNILNTIPELADSYSEIIYLWDNISGQDLYDEIPEDWLLANTEGESEDAFYHKFSQVIEKQYGFFRDLMDTHEYSEEDLIQLGQFLLNNGLTDIREIEDDIDILDKYKKTFKNSPLHNLDFSCHSFYIPYDLVESIKNFGSCSLVGGAIDECLKEFKILCLILNIEVTVLVDQCY